MASKVKDTLLHIDTSWYTQQGSRYLDIVGDWCGSELWILDGDSLLETILDDPLFALGKEGAPTPSRYNALRKSIYAPSLPIKPFKALSKVPRTSEESLVFLHPIASLAVGLPRLPEDLSLWSELKKADPSLSQDLEPSKFFSSTQVIAQVDVFRYEMALKMELSRLMRGSEEIDSPFRTVVNSFADPVKNRTRPVEEVFETGRDAFFSMITPMLSDLEAAGQLPAILFNFDRNACEELAHRIHIDLTSAETEWRRTSPVWAAKVREHEAWLKESKARQKEDELRSKRKKVDEDDKGDLRTGGGDESAAASFDVEDPSPMFTFAGIKTSYSKQQMLEDFDDLIWVIPKSSRWLLDALRRGVSVHHAGTNRRYRALVEGLFRLGFLRVIVATGTLSMGINMPAKTVVFAGDSVFLTALVSRQCAGRAGRRGFDLLGNVLFYGIPFERVQAILLSLVPRLGGTFPLTSSLGEHRLVLLLECTDTDFASFTLNRSPSTAQRLDWLGERSRCDEGGSVALPASSSLRDYLRRANLIDAEGRPLNLFPIASHLYHTEPSNFALISLLQSGALHDMAASFYTHPTDTAISLVSVLSHLFGRIRRRPQSSASMLTLVKSTPSQIVLDPLHNDVLRVLKRHQRQIVDTFTAYASNYVQQYSSHLGEDNRLPLSNLVVGPSQDSDEPSIPFIQTNLASTSIPYETRSSFVALSGHGDAFVSIPELSTTSREGIHLNQHAVPSLVDLTNEEFDLNSYLVDFLKHGQLEALVKGNGIRRGDVWFVLQEFSLTLAVVCSSLQTLLIEASAAASQGVDDEIVVSILMRRKKETTRRHKSGLDLLGLAIATGPSTSLSDTPNKPSTFDSKPSLLSFSPSLSFSSLLPALLPSLPLRLFPSSFT
ncbi:hypothetical protein BDY24DRAFT_436096 [Mrakia frigida]|uniref:uncharacterized protein n=1 Tax=Mrakia frigida TaxID=29902 RepID=UPI003FCC1A9C